MVYKATTLLAKQSPAKTRPAQTTIEQAHASPVMISLYKASVNLHLPKQGPAAQLTFLESHKPSAHNTNCIIHFYRTYIYNAREGKQEFLAGSHTAHIYLANSQQRPQHISEFVQQPIYFGQR